MAARRVASRERRVASRSKEGKKGRFALINRKDGFDMHFFVLLMIVLIIGLATLYSASHVYSFNYNEGDSYFFIRKQAGFALGGFFVMLFVSMVDYHAWHYAAWGAWFVSLGMLVLALITPAEKDVHRWITIAGVRFQPSEIAKFAVVLLLAHYISLNYKRMKKFLPGFIFPLILIGITCVLVLREPHLSGTLLIAILGIGLMWVGGTRFVYLAGTGILGAGAVAYLILVKGYEQDRILVWRYPLESFANQIEFPGNEVGRDKAWQTVQSLYAIGSGGLLGQGPGNSRQKHLFLPEPQNDFIFSVFCEEMGFVGAVLVLLLFGLLMWRGFKIALNAPDKFGCLLVIGLTLQIAAQAAINVAVVSNLFPNTGISLPFFSSGGTSLLVLMVQMGIVLSVSRQSKLEKL